MRRPWLVFGLVSILVLAAITWASVIMIELERSETEAKRETEYQNNVWKAIRRIDAWIDRMLIREEERPPSDYDSFSDVNDVYAKADLAKVDEALSKPSPLLREQSSFVRLYFQIDDSGTMTSPQVPRSNYQELAVPQFLSQQQWAQNASQLATIRKTIKKDRLQRQVADAIQIRARAQSEAQQVGQMRGKETPDPFGPFWEGSDLFFARRVKRGDAQTIQGFRADWPAIKKALLAEVRDLYPNASLRAWTNQDVSHRLYSLPVVLAPGAAPVIAAAPWTATHTVVAVVWAVILVCLLMMGLAIRRFIEYGARQRRFASMVTHELRSPLTTFRLYADLLAEKLVTDTKKTDEYHKSLQNTSAHMARMVENVIAHSRIEEGRAKLTPVRQTVDELFQRVRGDLVGRVGRAGLTLEFDLAPAIAERELETDAGAVGQILRNLIENACKYGRSEHVPSMTLMVQRVPNGIRITLRDFGGGISPRYEPRIFRPFERGGRDEADPERGLGLGLPLCRGLARDLGGTLHYQRPDGPGASFVLELPA